MSSGDPRDVTVVEDVADAMFRRMDQGGTNEDEVLRAATLGERAVYALAVTDDEVNSGGFAQFFTNSSGSLIEQAIAGAGLVGSREHERVLRRAAAIFPGSRIPKDRERRNAAFDALPSSSNGRLGSLDQRWYEVDKRLEARLRSYIAAHPAQFFRH